MIEIRCHTVPWNDRIDILIAERDYRGRVAVAKPLIFEMMPDGSQVEAPTLSLHFDKAQLLIDELWKCGLRPSEGTGSAGSLKATERHLEDMRKLTMDLVANKLKGD